MALNVALLTSHRSIPNIVLNAQERADVIAFIMTLKKGWPILSEPTTAK